MHHHDQTAYAARCAPTIIARCASSSDAASGIFLLSFEIGDVCNIVVRRLVRRTRTLVARCGSRHPRRRTRAARACGVLALRTLERVRGGQEHDVIRLIGRDEQPGHCLKVGHLHCRALWQLVELASLLARIREVLPHGLQVTQAEEEHLALLAASGLHGECLAPEERHQPARGSERGWVLLLARALHDVPRRGDLSHRRDDHKGLLGLLGLVGRVGADDVCERHANHLRLQLNARVLAHRPQKGLRIRMLCEEVCELLAILRRHGERRGAVSDSGSKDGHRGQLLRNLFEALVQVGDRRQLVGCQRKLLAAATSTANAAAAGGLLCGCRCARLIARTGAARDSLLLRLGTRVCLRRHAGKRVVAVDKLSHPV
mmetsp:Transcript_17625/g.45231  ORF Transcript_17625/g.45231 Transcript_17625/m.45231 type:complete len:373 (-) Transcript_17625:12-1130(-)